jgi:hypothetical protein
MNTANSLADQLRDWYAHSPTAQRAYARFRADVSTVSERAGPTLSDFWERIAPIIDPPGKKPDAKDAT